jgi:CheY-like chemotaxis protein
MTNPKQPPKVLLVDDRRDNLIALQAMLQGLPLEVVAVDSGDDALKQLLLDDFALILLDAQMPDLDGFETAELIKRRERTRHVPIIFLTAGDRDAQLALRGYAVGAVDYLNKPFEPWILRAKVSVFLDLWLKSRQVRAQADTTDLQLRQGRRLLAAVGDALTILAQDDGGRELAAKVLRDARDQASSTFTSAHDPA